MTVNYKTFGFVLRYVDHARRTERAFKVHIHLTKSRLYSVSYKYTYGPSSGEFWEHAKHYKKKKNMLKAVSNEAFHQRVPPLKRDALITQIKKHYRGE